MFWKAKMGCLDMEYYMPIMVMVLIQFIYAGMNLGIRVTLLEGMSPNVFVVYRSAFATIFLAPIAYFSGYVYIYICFTITISFFVIIPLISSVFILFFCRRNSASYSLNLRSFSLIFMTSLIGYVSIF